MEAVIDNVIPFEAPWERVHQEDVSAVMENLIDPGEAPAAEDGEGGTSVLLSSLQDFLDAASVMIVAVDRAGRVILVNREGSLVLGLPREAVVGREWLSFIPVTWKQEASSLLTDLLEAPSEDGRVREMPVMTASGGLRRMVWRNVPLRNRSGGSTGILCLGVDHSERRRWERRITDAIEEDKKAFGQSLHDNLGGTLTAIGYTAQFLREKAAAGKTDLRAAAEIVRLAASGAKEVRRVARGLYPVELPVNGLAQALRSLARATAAQYGVPCEVRHEGDGAVQNQSIQIQLFRIAQEAVTNAVKHASPERITIRLEVGGWGGTLTVEDDGRGLPERPGEGMGMHIMRHRASAIGADFEARPGKKGGVVVACRWRSQGGPDEAK
jgi:PAS domain S-box-containing protein